MNSSTIKADFGAAFVGALATLPQAVAYGLIAISPLGAEWAVFGITASVGSAILFGMLSGGFSSNPFLISGPRAATALALATGIQAALSLGYDPNDAVILAFAGVALSGVFQFCAGIARLGHLVSYVPVPVLAGFVSASALLVFLSAIPMALGIPQLSVRDVFMGGFMIASLWAISISGLTIFANFALAGRIRILPSALLGLVIGAVAYEIGNQYFGYSDAPLIGYIDFIHLVKTEMFFEGSLTWGHVLKDADIPLLTALLISLFTSFDTVLSVTAIDEMKGTDSDANHDLRVHGLFNALMGILGFLTGSGTLPRSQAIINSGAVTRAANVGTGFFFFVLLAILAPVVADLPLWATSGMLVATSLQSFDKPTREKIKSLLSNAVPYRRVLVGDVLVTLVVVGTAVALNLIAAVGVGIVMSIVLFVLGMGRNPVRRTYVGSKVHSKVLRPSSQTEILENEGRHIAVIELQGALFFGSCAALQSRAKRLIANGAEYLILDFRHLTSIDSTGSALLRALALRCAESGGRLLLSCIEQERRFDLTSRRRYSDAERKEAREKAALSTTPVTGPPRWVWLNMQANGVISTIGENGIFDDTDSALATCEEILLRQLGWSSASGYKGVIANSSAFTNLSREQIINLGHYAKRQKFATDQIVFNQSDKAQRAYFLVAGRMDVLINIPGSYRKRRVSALAGGTVFGEMGLIDGGIRSATIKTVRPSVCFSIDVEGFERLQIEMPDVALILMRNMSRQFAERLRLANNIISELEQ